MMIVVLFGSISHRLSSHCWDIQERFWDKKRMPIHRRLV
jgi:hypothetical protein